ncbi:hypothetical protein BD311DRAFT_764545 [Dichomitus squalens]|uniref:Uncharacterized protein n=1 Tax=Dichomitus squalens TaxID=114155 RepID=A0A4V2JZK5_9APHY|nr:hypothetical protein BD311DRAFT_764545 [Dichomitus squalens]
MESAEVSADSHSHHPRSTLAPKSRAYTNARRESHRSDSPPWSVRHDWACPFLRSIGGIHRRSGRIFLGCCPFNFGAVVLCTVR